MDVLKIPEYAKEIDDLFEKKFNFKKESSWELSTDYLEDVCWNVSSLNALKHDLNATKSLLNDKGEEWHEHTAKINKSAYVTDFIKSRIRPEILTQAWCKFYEILSSFKLFNQHKKHIRSLHLCEAPGAFISAINYYLCVNSPSMDWKWIANTLNPYYEGHSIRTVSIDDRLLFPTLKNWYFGNDNTGDIMDPNYIDEICNLGYEIGYFDLVTADGSIDCLNNPGEQELIVANLSFVEVLIALSCLLPGGTFVIKKFTFFECVTICQLYLLNCAFEKVHAYKPFTSRSSNSEVYVICIGFQGSEVLSNILENYKYIYRTKNALAFFPKSVIPESFLQQLETCSTYFTNLQISAINENLALYPLQDEFLIQKLNDTKQACAEAFIHKYSVFYSSVYDACKLYTTKKKVITSFCNTTNRNHKILYFQAVGDTFNNIKKSSFLLWYDKLLDVEKRISILFPTNKKRKLEEIEWIYPWKEIRMKMKSKNFQNWITTGKAINCINNSKFCFPGLLYLWNQVSNDSKIDVNLHIVSTCYWDMKTIVSALREKPSSKNIMVVSISLHCYEKDKLLLHLKQVFDNTIIYSNVNVEPEINLVTGNKTVYVNSGVWVDSLHQECLIKKRLTEVLHTVLKIIKKGDNLLLCIQSVFTRYTAGLVFIILSLFEKFTVVLSESVAPACVEQVWIFKNFQECKWFNNAFEYLEVIKQLNMSDTNEILEVVSISSLCGSGFQVYLRDLNNKHLLHRLQSLISAEKGKFENSLNCT